MKKVLLVLSLMVFVVTLASPAVAAPIETKAGTKAVVFQFSGLSNLGLGTYNGGIGMRYYLNDGMALRPGLQLGFSSTKDKVTDPETKTTNYNVGANITLEKHLPGAKSISPYVGAQVGVRMGQDKDTQGDNEITDKTMGVGLGGVLGFEWGFTESVTLGGEYNLGLNFGTRKVEHKLNNSTTTTTDESGMSLGIGTASVFISVAW